MGIRCCDREHGCGAGGFQRFTGPCLRVAQGGRKLRPTALDGRPIRRLGWHRAALSAGLCDGLPDARGFGRPQVVQHADIPWRPRGAEHRRDLRPTDFGSRSALARHHGLDALAPERGEPRHRRPIVLRHRADHPCPAGGAAIPAGHREVDTRGIDARAALGVARRDLLPGASPRRLDARGVLLAGVERLFWRGNPRRWSTRPGVGTLTRTPVSAATPVQNASSLASGLAPISRGRIAGAAAPRRGFWPPACSFGARAPVARYGRSPFSTTARLTPKMSARRRCEPRCRSQARRIF
jgi:hypothetical protein